MTKEHILKRVQALQPTYLPEWRTDNKEDVGWAVAENFANILSDLEQEYAAFPHKLFIAYLDALGFRQNPPLSASVPVTFLLTKNFKGSTLIPKGAKVATQSKINFETTQAIVASSSKLIALVDFERKGKNTFINNHAEALALNEEIALFKQNREKHYIYFGDDGLFDIHKRIDTPVGLLYTVPNFRNSNWEYFGQKNEESDARWYSFKRKGVELEKINNYKTVKREINGIESYWIRARVEPEAMFENDFRINFNSRSNVDALFHNDKPIFFKDGFLPFGELPQSNDLLYIASREAFSKKGFMVTVTLSFTFTEIVDKEEIALAWEYWNGKSWKALKGEAFKVPRDMAETKVNGEENYWIRVRLLNNAPFVTYKCSGENLEAEIHEHKVSLRIDVEEHKERGVLPKHLYGYALGAYTGLPKSLTEEDLEDEKSLYFAFDKAFEQGLFSMYLEMSKATLEKQDLQWQYFSENEGWEMLSIKDGTDGLNKNGYCQFIAPPNQAEHERFGQTGYWFKASFPQTSTENKSIKSIYLNTIEAKERSSKNNILLGSSNGSGFQVFKLKEKNLVELKLWVLEEKLPEGYGGYKDRLDEGYWVLWNQVSHFDRAFSSERIYTFNASLGEIGFADDREGKIPPIGQDNLVVSYRTGGGKEGNVSAHEITKVVNTLAYVDKVDNPIEASGGAALQSVENLIHMAPKAIRHRYRAVSEEDYAYLLRDASSDVAKVSLLSHQDEMALYIVPFSQQAQPMPSVELRALVKRYVEKASPATLSIEILAPSYVTVSLELKIALSDWRFASTIKPTVKEKLKAFLHPLEGNHDGEGWAFAELPLLADFYRLLDEVEGIALVEELSVLLSSGDAYALNQQSMPELSKEMLICNGLHRIELQDGGA